MNFALMIPRIFHGEKSRTRPLAEAACRQRSRASRRRRSRANLSLRTRPETIEDLTIANGKATAATLSGPGGPVALGGGVLNNGANLTLDRVTMTNNQSVGTGANLAAGGAVPRFPVGGPG